MKKDNKKPKGPKKIKKTSNLMFWILRVTLRPVLWLKYRFKFEYKSSKGIKQPCLILSNHQTSFDQFVVGFGFKFGINYVASDSIFRHGFKSWLMRMLTRPIPYSKGSSDSVSVRDIFSVIKKGGAVGMFASGNRSFFGEECTIKPGIGKLAKKLGVPVVIVQMRGGYNTKPRWLVKPSKGKMRACVSRIISPSELKDLPVEQLEDMIIKELYFDEYAWNRKEQIVFRGKRKAEHLETMLFYCPECNSLTHLSSSGNELFCKNCGMRVKINGTGFFENVHNGKNCPDTILELSKQQLEYIKSIDYQKFMDKPLFSDDDVKLSLASRAKNQTLLGTGAIALYGDRITVCGHTFPAEKIKDMSIQSIYRLTIYSDEGVFVVDMPKRTNPVKYMICGYHLKNIALNIEDGHYGY